MPVGDDLVKVLDEHCHHRKRKAPDLVGVGVDRWGHGLSVRDETKPRVAEFSLPISAPGTTPSRCATGCSSPHGRASSLRLAHCPLSWHPAADHRSGGRIAVRCGSLGGRATGQTGGSG